MFHMHIDSDDEEVSTHDDSLSDVNVKVKRFYLSRLSENDLKGILITAETEKFTVEKRITLELEHPDHFGLILLNYKGPESDDYFPLNSTVKVKEILLRKSITEIIGSNLEDQLKNTIDGGIRRIITKNGYDCRYLCEKAIGYKYTVVLQMKLEIIDTNNSFRRFSLYLDDGSGILLCHAIRNKDMKSIKVLLNLKFNINARSETSETPLHVVVDLEMSDVVNLLISNGADVNATNRQSQVPLHIAAKKSNLKILNSLLNNQAKLNERDKDGRTALHYAVDGENVDVFVIFLKRGANYELKDKWGLTPFQQAFKMKRLKIIKVFLDSKLDINVKVGVDSTLLHHAVAAGNESVVDLLISEGADVNATNRQGQVPLHYAAKSNNLKILNSLLKNQANLNAKDEDGQTPLHYAVFNGNENVVNYLIKEGAAVYVLDNYSQVPLHYAVEKNNINILDSLLRSQAGLNARDSNGQTPLHYAVFNGNRNVVDLLISKGADVNTTNMLTQVPLHYVAENNNLKILDSLLKNQAKLDERDKDGRTALHYAVAAGNMDVVDILLKRGADYKLKDRWGHTPFHLAVIHVNLDMIKVFLDNKVDANIVNSRKQTPLHAIGETTSTNISFGVKATDKDTYSKIINALLKNGENINFQDEDGNTPLHHAVINNNSELIQALLECNADPAIKNYFGNNVLHYASRSGQAENCIQDILDSSVNIDAVDTDRDTALHMAIQSDNYNIVKLILKKNPNIDMKNKIGDTALHKAVKYKHYHMVNFLLQNGANVNLKDADGNTALHLAIEFYQPRIIILLIQNKANVDLKDPSGKTALHLAVKLTEIPIEIIEAILYYTNNIDAKDKHGKTALHDAAYDRTLKVLLKAKADVNAVDNDMRTPFHYACWNKNVKAVKYLIENGADSSMRDRDGRTVFHYTCMIKEDQENRVSGEVLRDLLNILFEEDISVNCVDEFGKTPLHYVVEEKYYRSLDLYELFLKIGADINIEDKDHNTVIDIFLKQFYIFQYSNTKPFIEHVIKMQEMGMWVREKTLDKFIKVNDQYDLHKIQLYERDGRKEVDLMNTNIDQSDITYYNFLKKSPHKAVNYTRNRKVVNAIKSDELLAVFPIYGNFLKCHLRDIQRRCNLYEKIQRFLKSNIFERLPMDCMHEIFQYLNNSDLNNFLQALKPVFLKK